MNQEITTVDGQLIQKGKSIPVRATYASKYSLLIEFPEGHDFADKTKFSSLSLQLNPDVFEFGECELMLEANIDGHAGRLIFTDNVHNFDVLFQKKVNVNLQTFFHNLPLILAYKDRIKPSFKDYTSNLSYDLSVYRQYFDHIDEEYKNEPEHIKEAIQSVVIEGEGRKFMDYLDLKLGELGEEIKDFTREEHERHGFYFRKQMWNFIMSSHFMSLTNLKPRGYVGDSEMMRIIYENDYVGDSTFSKLMHKHPVEHPAAQAVRNRRELITSVLKETYGLFKNLPDRGFRVLSVACGPAVEMQDLLASQKDFKKYSFTLLDQDRHALLEAAKGIEQIEKKFKLHPKVVYLKDSVRTMLGTSKISEKWGQFQYIYSMGLFDYLTPPVASAVLQKLYEMLVPGGTIVLGNFHVDNPSKHYMEYWCDWVLYYRTEEDMLNLLEVPGAKKLVTFEDTRSQMFLKIIKE